MLGYDLNRDNGGMFYNFFILFCRYYAGLSDKNEGAVIPAGGQSQQLFIFFSPKDLILAFSHVSVPFSLCLYIFFATGT